MVCVSTIFVAVLRKHICDGCRVETLATTPGAPLELGWVEDDYPGGPHHFCPECVVTQKIDVGTPDDWRVAWEQFG